MYFIVSTVWNMKLYNKDIYTVNCISLYILKVMKNKF